MKQFIKSLLLVSMAIFTMVACDKEDVQGDNGQLDVTRHNISGVWSLKTWNGNALAEGSFVYIEFERADRTYTMWQNLDSAPTRKLTGIYNIDLDEELGAVIRGNYDNGNGDWNHQYVVRSLTADEMILVAKDDADDICVYVRAELPEELQEEE